VKWASMGFEYSRWRFNLLSPSSAVTLIATTLEYFPTDRQFLGLIQPWPEPGSVWSYWISNYCPLPTDS
jgi:hypothetical protein